MFLRSLLERIKREPALVSGLVAAGIALATAFGLDLTKEQVGAIMAFVAAILAFVVRQSVTPNVSVAAKADPPSQPVAGPAADGITTGEPVNVTPAVGAAGGQLLPSQFFAAPLVGPPATRPSRKGRAFIVGALLLTLVVELVGVFGDTDTISGLTADVFHTDTGSGRAIFTVLWLVFAAWFLHHIWFWGRSIKNPDRLDADQRR